MIIDGAVTPIKITIYFKLLYEDIRILFDMGKTYKYEVLGITYYEGIPEGTSNTFDTLKDAKEFVEGAKGSSSSWINRTIFKYEERNEDYYRYVKRVWINKNGKWFSTRKVYKLFMRMYLI